MPNFDQTGPRGEGSGTGRGRGKCADAAGSGSGGGRGRGCGGGRGRGRGRGCGGRGFFPGDELSVEERKSRYREFLEGELKRLETIDS